MNVGKRRVAKILQPVAWLIPARLLPGCSILVWFALVVGCGSSPPVEPTVTPPPAATNNVNPAGLAGRTLYFNGVVLGPTHVAELSVLETNRGALLPSGEYWYDARSGALGEWGGPTLEFVTAGLNLGGSLPANASASSTHVFLNGREVHTLDLARIEALIGRSVPLGRYWMDANGDAGPEGGGALINVFAEVARQQAESPGQAPAPIPGSVR